MARISGNEITIIVSPGELSLILLGLAWIAMGKNSDPETSSRATKLKEELSEIHKSLWREKSTPPAR